MSLVEKALKKMASARAASSQPGNPARRGGEPAVPEISRASPIITAAVPREQQPPAPAPPQVPVARTDKIVPIDHVALRRASLLPTEEEDRRLTAEYRHIKRPLLAAARARGTPSLPNGRVIMIASALPGEGKTFTSINLAMSIALEKETSVVLIDGDFAKAHLSRAFGVREEPGMTDLLLEEEFDAAAAILPTSVRGLSILPAGRRADTATELIASARMERVIASILSRDPSRILVFDSPPLLLTTESRALAGVAGQIVVVVRAESTVHKAVVDALRYLGDGKPVGLVLNQCRSNPTHGYYGYGEYGESAESGSRPR